MPRPRRTTAQAAKPLTLGFFGSADIPKKTIVPLLDDLIDGRTVKMVIIPATPTDLTGSLIDIATWALENKLELATVSTDESVKDADCNEILETATGDDYEAGDDAAAVIVEALEEAADTDARMIFLLDQESDSDLDAAGLALEQNVAAFDLSAGLDLITEGEEDEPEAAPEPDPEPEKPTRGRRARAAKADPEPEETESEPEEHTRDELKGWTMTELKKLAREKAGATTDDMRSKTKDFVIDLILGDGAAPEEANEPEEEPVAEEKPTRGRRSRAAKAEPKEDDADEAQAETESARAIRVSKEHMANGAKEAGITTSKNLSVTPVAAKVAEQGGAIDYDLLSEAIHKALAPLVAEAVAELRKPKPRGRPPKED